MPPIRKPESTKNRSTPLQGSWPEATSAEIKEEWDSMPSTEVTPKIAWRRRTRPIAMPRRPSSAGMRADQLGAEAGAEEQESAGIEAARIPSALLFLGVRQYDVRV